MLSVLAGDIAGKTAGAAGPGNIFIPPTALCEVPWAVVDGNNLDYGNMKWLKLSRLSDLRTKCGDSVDLRPHPLGITAQDYTRDSKWI